MNLPDNYGNMSRMDALGSSHQKFPTNMPHGCIGEYVYRVMEVHDALLKNFHMTLVTKSMFMAWVHIKI